MRKEGLKSQKHMKLSALTLFLILLIECCTLPLAAAGRFAVSAPVLTVTLKEPDASSSSNGNNNNNNNNNNKSNNKISSSSEAGIGKWLDISSLRPNILWSIASQSPPLPAWFPALRSIKANIGYRYEDLQNLPSFVEADVKLSNDQLNSDLQIQPSYEFRTQRTNVLVQLSKGPSYILGRFTSRGNRWLEMIRASLCVQHLPFASLTAVRVTANMDLKTKQPTCIIEGITSSQRTKTVLNLEYNNPTLTVVHALDDRHTIAPEISLYNANIIYQWNIALDSGSIRTKVDPTSAIHVTWTDNSKTGKWVTDFRLPLEGISVQALTADIRVRRQFSF